ncbi:uncharacterized protein [Montipora capricornis]|uniref:uncharacterized protein n=1 Tax=Montipora capricornis TaxID=246305 RepID=UPI0035F12000
MEQLEDIDYTDDIALISQRHTDMKEKLLKLDEEARKTGLKINVKKTKKGGTDQDIRIQVGKAAGVFNTLRPINTKLRIYNSNVKSVLLYGCETWRVLKSSMAKIQVFMNRCLRQILGVRWYDRLRNEELWRSTSQEPIEQQIIWTHAEETCRQRHTKRATVDTPREARTAEDHLAALN